MLISMGAAIQLNAKYTQNTFNKQLVDIFVFQVIVTQLAKYLNFFLAKYLQDKIRYSFGQK